MLTIDTIFTVSIFLFLEPWTRCFVIVLNTFPPKSHRGARLSLLSLGREAGTLSLFFYYDLFSMIYYIIVIK